MIRETGLKCVLLMVSIGLASGAEDAKPEPITLRGVVVDESGKPVAGAEVLANPFGLYEARSVADDEGAFAIPLADRLASRPLLLARTADGRKLGIFQPAPATDKEKADAPIRIVLKPGREVAATVADEKGNPIADALVEVAGAPAGLKGWISTLAHETTEADGAARLLLPVDAEVAWIVAKKEGRGLDFAEFATYANGVSVDHGEPAGAIPETTALTLGAPRVVRLKAVDDAGQPVAGIMFYPFGLRKLGRRGLLNYSTRALAATTDDDGEAAFDWLPQSPDPLEFFASTVDYVHRRVTLDPGENAATVRLEPTVAIRGRVTLADGSPAEGVRLIARGSGRGLDGGRGRARTAADGSYSMKVDANEGYVVYVDDEDRAAPARLDVAVRSGKPVDGVDFQLGPGTLIQGTVSADSDGSPVPDVFIYLTETGDEVPADLRDKDDNRRREFRRQLHARADDQGRFAIRVGPGVYTVFAVAGRRQSESRKITVKSEGELTCDLLVPRPADRGRLAGKVVDPDGRALVGATVAFLNGEDSWESAAPARTNADGRFEVERALQRGFVYAKSLDGTLGAFVPIDPEAADLTITLAPTAEIRGTVLDEMGRPAANQKLRLWVEYPTRIQGRETNSSLSDGDFTTDAEGRFEAHGLVIGQDYEIGYHQFQGRGWLGEARAEALGSLDLGTLRIGDVDFEARSPKVGDVAPELFGAETLFGEPLKLADFQGKFILLHYLYPNPELPEPALQDLCDSFRDDDRLVILNLHYGQSAVEAREYQLMHKIVSSSALIQGHGESHLLYGVRSFPCFILIGPDGKIVARGMPDERVKQIVARALEWTP